MERLRLVFFACRTALLLPFSWTTTVPIGAIGVGVSVGVGGTVLSTSVCSIEELSCRFGSGMAETALAVFDTLPATAGAVTTTETSAVLPAAIVPREQVTAPTAAVQLPASVSADTTTPPAGGLSVRTAAVASSGPPLCTRMT